MKPTVTGSKLFITLAAMSGALMALAIWMAITAENPAATRPR